MVETTTARRCIDWRLLGCFLCIGIDGLAMLQHQTGFAGGITVALLIFTFVEVAS